MGIHDIDTMNQLREELLKIDPTIFVYGEGWVAADSPLPFEQRAVKENVRKMKGISVFNDEFRDGLKGSTLTNRNQGMPPEISTGILNLSNMESLAEHNTHR